jgi:hypothetical protein
VIRATSEFVERLGREPLRWTQPRRFQRGWELWSGNHRLATLASEGPFWNPRLVATSPGGTWHVDREWTGVDLRRAGAEQALVEFRGLYGIFTTQGQIRIGEEAFTWRTRLHLLRWSSFELRNASDFPLLAIEPRLTLLRYEGTLTLEDAGRRHAHIEPLAMLAWALAVAALRRAAH